MVATDKQHVGQQMCVSDPDKSCMVLEIGGLIRACDACMLRTWPQYGFPSETASVCDPRAGEQSCSAGEQDRTPDGAYWCVPWLYECEEED